MLTKQDEADDLDFDVARLTWLLTALNDVIEQHDKLQPDYPFLADATAESARRELGAVEAKIMELKTRIERLKRE